MSEIIHYFTPTKAAAALLRGMARQAFSEGFAHLYDPAPFARFLDEAYGPGGAMERGLADPSIRWRVAASGEEPIGYAKLSSLMAPRLRRSQGRWSCSRCAFSPRGTGVEWRKA